MVARPLSSPLAEATIARMMLTSITVAAAVAQTITPVRHPLNRLSTLVSQLSVLSGPSRLLSKGALANPFSPSCDIIVVEDITG